ncbi:MULTISPECIES: ABC transporter permease [unclassified Aureimonas]|uniref:ABC transporter permease n=1 Tax=unclassified Aureimonas TaxID=2615206 RepID=UPI0007020E20|nr:MULTISPECIES: FtsX-like permease family protein [unclassified Aureimonas]KQT65840.1 hypothetical protein ASG62_21335 [Aureimonas sp. Leaf427]KQT78060.1 hypothetical protein ASG54_03300 [Aureimonas sp. Leaf460]
MSTVPRQILVLTRASLAGMPRRAAVSLSMVLSIALVVAVLVGFLAMAAGLGRTTNSGGSPSVAVILGGGSTLEIASSVVPEAVRNLETHGRQAGIASDANGRLLVSREILVPVEASAPDGAAQTVSLRGMDAAGLALRDGAAITGRAFAPGSHDIVVGARLAQDLGGLGPGGTIRLGPVDWTVSGIVAAGGGLAESEIWGDLTTVRAVFDRQGEIQTVRLRLDGPDALAKLQSALPNASATPLAAMTEASFLAGQSARTEWLVTLFGWPVALLMAIGAAAGALNTMMTSVSDRASEIATVRVLGFSRRAAFTATFAEAILLSFAGAVLGAFASWGLLDGWQSSTLGANETRVAFQLAVTPAVLLQAGWLALAIGGIGGALPAYAATRLPLVSALRQNG